MCSVARGTVNSLPEAQGGEPFMPRVLIWEDYPPLRRAQAIALKRAGWQVVSAASAREVLRALGQHGVDVLLIDMEMANGESWRVVQVLHTGHHRWPVVALLSPASRRYQELEALGVEVILRKPITRETLLTGVKMAIQAPGQGPS